MKRNMKVIGALFQKDCKDTLQNMNVMIMIFLPLVFGVLYTSLFSDISAEIPANYVLGMITSMTLALVPTTFLSVLVAEEKEKHTLRTLMLSGVTGGEFMASKTLLTLVLMEVLSVACFFVTKGEPRLLPAYLLLVTAGSLGLLLIGATIGLLCKDQMSTSVLSAPIALVLMIPPMLGSLNDTLAFIAKLTPIQWVLRLLAWVQGGGSLISAEGGKGALVLLAWIVLPAIVFGVVYRRKRLD
jgi:ABC-2 type transport system permease protein